MYKSVLSRPKTIFALYDVANSGYVLIFQSFLFPLLFVTAFTLSQGDSPELVANANTYWAWLVAATGIAAIVLAPAVGRRGDRGNRGILFTNLVIGVAVLAAAAAMFGSTSPIVLATAFFLFNVAFELSQSLYDSFLPDLANGRKELTQLSTRAWAAGYVGGAIFAVGYLLMERSGVSNSIVLAVAAGIFLMLSLPSMRLFRALGGRQQALQPAALETRPLRPPVAWTSLAVYWLIADSVAAVLYFAPLYAVQEIGLTSTRVGALMLGTQVVAIPFTLLSGAAAGRFGHRRTIQGCLVIS